MTLMKLRGGKQKFIGATFFRVTILAFTCNQDQYVKRLEFCNMLRLVSSSCIPVHLPVDLKRVGFRHRSPTSSLTLPTASNMSYEQRLIAAAKCIYSGDSSAGDGTSVEPVDFGITATLKPHQIEGVSWLIRRYLRGVNVILGNISLTNRTEDICVCHISLCYFAFS